MNEDRITGTAKKIVGQAEQGFANMTGDDSLAAKGAVNETAGTVQSLFGQAKDAVKSAIDSTSPRLKEATDTTVTTVRDAPLITAAIAGLAGFALAWALKTGTKA